MGSLAVGGTNQMDFVIGGSLGLAPQVLTKADFIWSFSKLTFPHQLMRLMLAEQIYRAQTIIAGESYHK
jgi:23S rRNA (pseudouridine1915-N3)-methyltransferase